MGSIQTSLDTPQSDLFNLKIYGSIDWGRIWSEMQQTELPPSLSNPLI